MSLRVWHPVVSSDEIARGIELRIAATGIGLSVELYPEEDEEGNA
jgi:hypothetical protein